MSSSFSRAGGVVAGPNCGYDDTVPTGCKNSTLALDVSGLALSSLTIAISTLLICENLSVIFLEGGGLGWGRLFLLDDGGGRGMGNPLFVVEWAAVSVLLLVGVAVLVRRDVDALLSFCWMSTDPL